MLQRYEANQKVLGIEFRIGEDVIKELQKQSEKRGINLDEYVHKILSSYSNYCNYTELLHYFLLSPEMFQRLVNQTNGANLEKIAKAYETDLLKQLRFVNIPMDSRSIMEFIEGVCFIRNIEFSENALNDNETRYTFCHESGKTWSMIKKIALESIMNSIGTPMKDFEVTDDFLSFTIKHQNELTV